MATIGMSNATCACEPHAAPAGRASWCGQLQLGTLSVPVKAYAAIASPPEVPLRQLHAGCGQGIEYRKWCAKHGAVPPEEIVRGYPYQQDQYVVLSDAELVELQPVDEKTIHLKHFLDPATVDLVLLAGRSLYLAPANPATRRPFATVYRALERSRKWALGRVVFSNRWQTVLVRPEKQVLLVHTLYHPAQRRALAGNGAADVEVAHQELRPVLRLIASADGRIPWDDYQDDSERRVTALVEAKLAPARNPRAARAKRRRASGSKSPAEPGTSRGASRARRKAA
jgi:DNA end-binding protein Ku